MLTVKVLNIAGKETGRTIELPESVFGIEPSNHAVWLDVRQYLAHQRQGTHKSKERNELSGSTRKLKKQKGTGGARAGDIKNPLFRGGARVFGPRPRTYGFKLNKKVKALARRSALSFKASTSNVVVVENFNLESHRTANTVNVLKSLGLANKKVMFVTNEKNDNLVLSSRNIPKVHVNIASDINTYQIVNAETIVLQEQAIETITNVLA